MDQKESKNETEKKLVYSLPDNLISQCIESRDSTMKELGHQMQQSVGKLAKVLSPLKQLIQISDMKEDYDEIKRAGHSSLAAFSGSTIGNIAECAATSGGALLTVTGLVSLPRSETIGSLGMTSGMLLMRESEKVGQVVKHYLPILVDNTLDKFGSLYASAEKFVKSAYQKYEHGTKYQEKKYPDIESVMVDLGFHDHVRELYVHLNENQRLTYSAVTRDLFLTYFSSHTSTPETPGNPDPNQVKNDIVRVQTSLSKSIKEVTQRVPKCFEEKKCVEFCEILTATSHGIALVSSLIGQHGFARTALQSASGVSQMVMGIAQVHAVGLAAGPVGMILSGMNTLLSCFNENESDMMEPFTQQMVILSQQIHALHEDMLVQFEKVFTALGILNTNIIHGFQTLHEDHSLLLSKIKKMHNDISSLQSSVNQVGSKVDQLNSDLHGYVLQDDRKQLQFVLNEIREKSKRSFNRLKLHPRVMAAFQTFDQNLISKKLSESKISPSDLSKHLRFQPGSAEATIGLLLNYAQHSLGLTVREPIADPIQWQQTTHLLTELVEKNNSIDRIGEQDYRDFQYLKQIGENWLYVIEQLPAQIHKLFQLYEDQVSHFLVLIKKEIGEFEFTTTQSLLPKFTGYDELKQMEEFKFDFKRNYSWCTATEDASACKGFHNRPRFMGYDGFSGDWFQHVENRKDEIAKKLASYKKEIDIIHEKRQTKDISLSLWDRKEIYPHLTSVFMFHETQPTIAPLLPLPQLKVPEWLLEAERFGIGTIRHSYQYENQKKEFIHKISFHFADQQKVILLGSNSRTCTILDHLSPSESQWHAHMGGTHTSNASYSLQARGAMWINPNQDYWVQQWCAYPNVTCSAGLRDQCTFEIKQESPEPSLLHKTKQKKMELRSTLNEKLLQQCESLDSRNLIANALLGVDCSAKVLLSFLSILLPSDAKQLSCVWTKDEITNFLKQYPSQSEVYLHHQLQTNLRVLHVAKAKLVEKLNSQTEIAYLPVKDTLKKLSEFLALYEKKTMKDSDLLDLDKKEAMVYGATRAFLVMQSEFLNQGNQEAALQISKLLQKYGMDTFSILSEPHNMQSVTLEHENKTNN